MGIQPRPHFLEHRFEVGPFAVELVDERQSRDLIAVGLAPDGFALGFDPFARREDDDGPVEHAQAALDLGREVDVAGRIDQVDRHVLPGNVTLAA
jgi:hypothetical protein